jgi:large subunit ribosomal protein L29
MKAKKLREQSSEELQQLVLETRRSMADTRAKKGTKDAAEHPMHVRVLRRDMARMLTVLRERGGEIHA